MSIARGWRIVYYQTLRGELPVRDFIQRLELKAKKKIYHALNLLAERGVELTFPQTRKLSGFEIWELRVLGSNNLRILYVLLPRRTFLILHAFAKKKQKTDNYEIKIARKRLQGFLVS